MNWEQEKTREFLDMYGIDKMESVNIFFAINSLHSKYLDNFIEEETTEKELNKIEKYLGIYWVGGQMRFTQEYKRQINSTGYEEFADRFEKELNND